MKVLTIVGTRPELIRLSLIIGKLDSAARKHILVHTGQNYDHRLRDIFFEQLGVRKPDYSIQLTSYSIGRQIGQMFAEVEQIIETEQPDRILLLGDTNSALCAVLGERMGIPVYHMEAGNRCFDHTVPEEINRKMIDSVSTVNMPYTSISRDNLLREGIAPNRIWISGNPICEVMQHYRPAYDASEILEQLGLTEGQYFLVTFHRAECVDNPVRLNQIVRALHLVAKQWSKPIVCSVHPRTQARLQQFGIHMTDPLIRLCPPFGFFEFMKLQQHAGCVITDSGTVQEESCILGIPSVTIRRSTERPETVLCGSNVISGLEDANRIADCVNLMLQANRSWSCPEGYLDPNVSDKVVNMIVGGVSHV